MLNPAGPPTWLHDPSRGSANKHFISPGRPHLWLLILNCPNAFYRALAIERDLPGPEPPTDEQSVHIVRGACESHQASTRVPNKVSHFDGCPAGASTIKPHPPGMPTGLQPCAIRLPGGTDELDISRWRAPELERSTE